MRTIYTLLLLIGASIPNVLGQIGLYNDGGQIFISPGSKIYVDGDIDNNTGTIKNEGTISFTGDFDNNASYQSTGKEVLCGNSQWLNGNFSGANDLFDVKIDLENSSDALLMGSDIEIDSAGSLEFVNGLIKAGSNELFIKNGEITMNFIDIFRLFT